LGSAKLVVAASDRDLQYKQFLIGTNLPVGPLNLSANYVYFNPDLGGSSNTLVVGADVELIPSTRVGVNYAYNNSNGTPPNYQPVSGLFTLKKYQTLCRLQSRNRRGTLFIFWK